MRWGISCLLPPTIYWAIKLIAKPTVLLSVPL
uniref:Uncharacterized protein n=1 Tax=Anguilla anguilla TaxID=7936 RepID=A0A0E9SLG3_ANGAN